MVVLVLVGACGVAIAAFRIFSGAEPFRTVRAPTSINFYLDGPYGPEFAGEMLAEKKGYFGREYIKTVLRPKPQSANFVDIVARDHAIGVTTGQKFLLARWRGAPVVAFGASFLDTPTAVFMLEKSGLRVPKDLIGKRLGVRPESEDGVIFDAMMAQLGLPRSQIRNIAVQDGFAALRNGEVDAVLAMIGSQPLPSDADPARFNVIKPQDYGIHVPGLVYFASSALVRDNPSVIRQSLRAIILGWRDVYTDTSQSAPAIVAFDPDRLTPERVKFALAQQRDLVRPNGMRIAEFEESRWRTLRDILLYAKLGEETIGLSSAVSYDFLRDAYRQPLNAQSGASAN